MHELEIVKNTQTLYTIRFLCTVDESGVRIVRQADGVYTGFDLKAPLPAGTQVIISVVPAGTYCDSIDLPHTQPEQQPPDGSYLRKVAEEACITASREVIATAIYHRTTVVVSREGEVAEADPMDLLEARLFNFVGSSET